MIEVNGCAFNVRGFGFNRWAAEVTESFLAVLAEVFLGCYVVAVFKFILKVEIWQTGQMLLLIVVAEGFRWHWAWR